jgi:hypothetical protein
MSIVNTAQTQSFAGLFRSPKKSKKMLLHDTVRVTAAPMQAGSLQGNRICPSTNLLPPVERVRPGAKTKFRQFLDSVSSLSTHQLAALLCEINRARSMRHCRHD